MLSTKFQLQASYIWTLSTALPVSHRANLLPWADRFWSVLHSTMKVYLHVKHAKHLLPISTSGTQLGYHSDLATKPFLLCKPILPKKQYMDPLKWANTCQEERGILSLCRNVTDLTTPEACESSSCQTTSGADKFDPHKLTWCQKLSCIIPFSFYFCGKKWYQWPLAKRNFGKKKQKKRKKKLKWGKGIHCTCLLPWSSATL